MATILKLWHQIDNLTPSIDVYSSKNNPTKFSPNPIWNDGALGFIEDSHPNNKNNTKMSTIE